MERIQGLNSENNKRIVKSTRDYWIDYNDKTRLDIQCGNSAYVFGYSDREILTAINNNNIHFIRNGANETSEFTKTVIKKLCNLSNMSGISWAVSGSDAVEAGIAMNDTYWASVDPVKCKIASILPNYHGTTYISKALRSEFDLSRVITVQRENALSRLEHLMIVGDLGLVVTESIPWINGVQPYNIKFWKDLRQLCDRYDVNLMIDDVAGSFGKLGHAFSYKAFGIEPDIVCIAKSLTGGYTPLSASLCNNKLYNVLKTGNWDHTHTWNPNSAGIAAANEVLKKVDNNIFDRVDYLSSKIKEVFKNLDLEYQGQGLMWQANAEFNFDKLDNLTYNIYESNYLPMVIPLIADDIYFDFVEENLRKAL